MTGKEERTPTNTGTTRRLTFHADSTFVLCHVGPCGLTSTYNMKAGRNYFTGKPDRVLYLNQRVIVDQGEEHIINFPYLIQECSNTLIIVQNGPDGYTDTYVRE